MRLINRLTKAGEIKTVVLRSDDVVIRTVGDKEIVYRRVDDVPSSSEDPLRRGPLHQGL